ncbi:MAG: hypothetical protein J6V32_06640 [Elusimicrobiaceae bacterium]|nr:hypothetical protein [Elusimicrobiaceae bacterium]
MTGETHKIRFKFANGEEFEAEGTLDFVEKQRDYFLALIKKQLPAAQNAYRVTEDRTVIGHLSTLERVRANNTTQSKPAQQTENPSWAPTQIPPVYNSRLWEQLLKQEGESLFLRRKLHLAADQAALLILSGREALLGKAGASALWLSGALEKSGFTIPRLDRVLAPALSLGYLQCEGIKRSRLYKLTPAGQAHAFVLAQKKAEGLL